MNAAFAGTSLAHRASRVLFCIEAMLIVVPLMALAGLLLFPFLLFVLASFGSMPFMPTRKIIVVLLIDLAALLALLQLLLVARASWLYIRGGRPALAGVTRGEWWMMLASLLLFPGVFAIWQLRDYVPNDPFGSIATVMMLAVPLALPMLHLLAAREIAAWHARRGTAP